MRMGVLAPYPLFELVATHWIFMLASFELVRALDRTLAVREIFDDSQVSILWTAGQQSFPGGFGSDEPSIEHTGQRRMSCSWLSTGMLDMPRQTQLASERGNCLLDACCIMIKVKGRWTTVQNH